MHSRPPALTARAACAALPVLLGIVTAQSPHPRVPPPTAHLPHPLVSEAPGEVRVLANGYKLIATASDVRFWPYCGPRGAGANLGLRLVRAEVGERMLPLKAARLSRLHHHLSLDHGSVEERWLWRNGEVEQQFVLQRAPGHGDLRLTLAVDTSLAIADSEVGIDFTDASGPLVHYGDVTVVDAAGQRVATRTQLLGRTLQLVVPESFVAGAKWPICIDPVVQTTRADGQAEHDALNPDVVITRDGRAVMVVFERRFSSLDTDIVAQLIAADGSRTIIAIESGTREAHNPAVAHDPRDDLFFVAWDEDRAFDRVVLGIAVSRTSTLGFPLLVRDAAGESNVNPAVAGPADRDPGAGRFLIASEQGAASLAYDVVDIRSRQVSARATRADLGLRRPRVNRVRTPGEPWLCVSERSGDAFVDAVTEAGPVGNPVTLATPEFDRQPVVAGRAGQYLVAWIREVPSTGIGRLAGRTIGIANGLPVVGNIILDLRSREPGAALSRDQSIPALGFDGTRYTVAYRERQQSGFDHPFAAVFGVAGNTVGFHDGHVALSSLDAPHGAIAMASEGETGIVSVRCAIVFDETVSATNRNVLVSEFEAFQPGPQIRTIEASCGGSRQPAVTTTGAPLLGRTVTLQTPAPGIALWLVGVPSPPVATCDSRCLLGVSPSFTFANSQLPLQIPIAPTIVGAEVAAQCVVLGAPAGCDATLIGLPFALTDTVVLTVR